jgi:putative transposase
MSSEILGAMVGLILLLVLVHAARLQASLVNLRQPYRRIAKSSHSPQKNAKRQRKPDWIRQDILRLKALLPASAGVRQIAALFNRIQASKVCSPKCNPWRVSKSYVANILRVHHLEALRIRESIRQRQPGISSICQTWGIDLTGKKDTSGHLHHILGIIDHGSRMALRLVVTSKHSRSLANHLLMACLALGKPKLIRTDNERCFTSSVFQKLIQAAGLHLQTTELHCPWQNGRIERLFGTLKAQLDQIQIQSAEHLQTLLDEFKLWYNTIRLHQHLGYQTPQEVWQQQKQPKKTFKPKAQPTWWTGWSGQLSGVQWRC